MTAETWPDLPLQAWADTCATLHLWTQIVGKLRCVLSPPENHTWHVAMYVTARGLTTTPIPHGTRTFEVDFDFIDQQLLVRANDGSAGALALRPQSVAAFYRALMRELDRLGLPVAIDRYPNELEPAERFDRDDVPRQYDAAFVQRYWRILVQADRVLKQFRARYVGKCSPVHYFWGAPDLAVSRFSGRRAPPHPGGIPRLPDRITRDAYSHELSSVGFWPGGGPMPHPAFYAYAYPEPAGFSAWRLQPDAAFYHPELREFILPYDAVRGAADPDAALLAFAQSSYEAAAELGGWDRLALER